MTMPNRRLRMIDPDADSPGEASLTSSASPPVLVMAGRPGENASLQRRIGLPLGDPAAWIGWPDGQTTGIVRDLETDRTRSVGRCDRVTDVARCPMPAHRTEWPVDRETAVAAALAGVLGERKVPVVQADRTLPLSFAWELMAAGIDIRYDDQMGVVDRRGKNEDEIAALADIQRKTETVMRQMLETIANAAVGQNGQLIGSDGPLTSESIRRQAAIALLRLGSSLTHGAIVAGPPHSGDCHHGGTGPLHSSVPIIVDLYPRDNTTRYYGDCTRTVVHGSPTEQVAAMHAAVLEAKDAAVSLCQPGQTAHAVHRRATDVLLAAGYVEQRGVISDGPTIQHGTGHGVGLELHEPILVDDGGPAIVLGEVLTIEPGLYGRHSGSVRIEDMIVATAGGPRNLNSLPAGLNWRG